MLMKLLLLEDDQILSQTIELFLLREGYSVDCALSIEEAESKTFEGGYDLYLFDIDLPSGSGLDLLRALRDAGDKTPTIFISALTDLYSISEGFSLDAIDYIKKPFDPKELLIRIEAKFKNRIWSYKNITFDEDAKVLRVDGEIVDIGNVQYEIFTKLLKNCGKVVEKEELYECLDHPSQAALRVAIVKIKQRLDVQIINIRSKGYILERV